LSVHNNILIWLSGADPESLDHCTLGERRKYLKLGLAILVPAILSWIGMWFAAPYIGFVSIGIRIFAATLWSSIILIVDMYLVSSLDKRIKLTNKWSYIRTTCFRLFLAAFLGLVISHPIVLKILESNIEQEIYEMKQEKIEQIRRQYRDTVAFENRINQVARDSVDQLISCKEKLLKAEANGLKVDIPCGSTLGIAGRDFRYYGIEAEIREHKRARDSLSNEIKTKESKTTKRVDEIIKTLPFSKDYLKRVRALEILKRDKLPDEWISHVTVLVWVLIFFFMLLDSIAVIAKVMLPVGEYEAVLTKIEKQKQLQLDDKIMLTDRVNTMDNRAKENLIAAIYQRAPYHNIAIIQAAVGSILSGKNPVSHITQDDNNRSIFTKLLVLVGTGIAAVPVYFILKYCGVSNDNLSIILSSYITLGATAATLIK
jgi:hypothetical protein